MCCTAGNYRVSDKTVGNSAYLGAYLCELLNIKADEVDKYCLRHYDVTHKICPAQMVEDVKLAVDGKAPVHFFGRTGGIIPTPAEIADEIRKIAGGFK